MCKLCNKHYKYSGHTTSNLIRHLQAMHKKHKSFTGGRQPLLVDLGFKPKEAYSLSSTKKRLLDDKVALFIAKDMRPVNVLKGQGFRELVQALDPQYQVSPHLTFKISVLTQQ